MAPSQIPSSRPTNRLEIAHFDSFTREEVSNSMAISKQKLGIGPLLRFQLPIHIHPNKKSGIAVYFSFLGDLV
jgi:hypothetical protein